MKIRKAGKRDIERCLDIEWPKAGKERKVLKSNFIRKLKSGLCTVLVAEVNREIVGFADARKEPWSNLLYIEQFYIDERRRDRGYGSKLLSEVIRKARRMGIRIIFVDLPPQHKRAMDFYLGNGFRRAGRIKGFYNDRKKPDAVVLSYRL